MREAIAGGSVLLVDKPAGPTSHDVVAAARRAFGVRKVGHAGTLDPFATGLLVLGLGRGTRLLEYLVGLDKVYDVTVRLGVATDSQDLSGVRVSEDDRWTEVSPDRIRSTAAGLVGTLFLRPPVYSAVKVAGVPAYRRTRRGERVELEPRRMIVRSLKVLEVAPPDIRFRVSCASGTYIRSLAVELGERLGTACQVGDLRRTRVGIFRVEDAASFASVRRATPPAGAWVDPVFALSHLPRRRVRPAEAGMLAAGRAIPADGSDSGPVACVLSDRELVAVGAVRDGNLEPKKVFWRG